MIQVTDDFAEMVMSDVKNLMKERDMAESRMYELEENTELLQSENELLQSENEYLQSEIKKKDKKIDELTEVVEDQQEKIEDLDENENKIYSLEEQIELCYEATVENDFLNEEIEKKNELIEKLNEIIEMQREAIEGLAKERDDASAYMYEMEEFGVKYQEKYLNMSSQFVKANQVARKFEDQLNQLQTEAKEIEEVIVKANDGYCVHCSKRLSWNNKSGICQDCKKNLKVLQQLVTARKDAGSNLNPLDKHDQDCLYNMEKTIENFIVKYKLKVKPQYS